MLFFKPTAVIALLVSAVIASPIELEARQAATNCGGTAFTLAAVRACTNAAYSYYQQGGTAGGSTYPHTFNNREGFSFSVAGPYQEFPLISSGAYSGGAPGAHRCIINTSGRYAGAVTHTGASGNNFVGCSGTSL